MLAHQFGIIDNIKQTNEFTYEPEKYHCIKIEDDIILSLLKRLNEIKTFFHNLNRPEFGLAYHGITIIPPGSLTYFEEILLNYRETNRSKGLDNLIRIVKQAISQNKYVIHFGI